MRTSKALALEEKVCVNYGNNCHWLSQLYRYLLKKAKFANTISAVALIPFGHSFYGKRASNTFNFLCNRYNGYTSFQKHVTFHAVNQTLISS